MVTFKKHNLMEQGAALGKFDVVFCRNVLIYFDQPTKTEALDRIAAQMNPGGFLLLGAAETTVGITSQFEPSNERRGLYKLAKQAVKAA
jgi:chemotaxis protein methyltransferase CheR